MKKILVSALMVLLVSAFGMPAMAVDHEFGGYWRTRFFNNTDFSGTDDGSQDVQKVDTRTRLSYTAVFSDELKLVNRFEMDATWGDSARGDIGADGQNFEIKHSYADFSLEDWNFKVGTQPKTFARGFLFDDDFSGAIVRYVGDDMIIPFIWMKVYEGGFGKDANDMDVDYFGLDPRFDMGDLKLNPFVLYATSAGGGTLVDDDGDPATADAWTGWSGATGWDAFSIYYLGANVDYSADMFSAWLTAIYMSGSVDVSDADATSGVYPDYYQDTVFGTDSFDFAGYLFAFGGAMNLDAVSLHGQFFYATGDDDGYDDDEVSMFWVPAGQSYYWAEIMGYGIFDDQVSAGSPGSSIGNIMAANVGLEYPMDKLTLALDLWYANLVEDNAAGENELGTEVDVTVTYQLLEDLTVKGVVAYLSAGEATGGGDENPMEVGVVMSLSF